MSKEYVKELNKAGVEIIKYGDMEIMPGSHTQDYCDYLTSTKGEAYFVNKDRLLEYCKDHGLILAVQQPINEIKPQFLLNEHGINHDGLSFDQLMCCIAQSPEESRHYVVDGIGPRDFVGPYVTESVLEEMQFQLKDETSQFRKLSNFPIERSFVYVDVSDFSQEPPGRQALIINSIISMVKTIHEKPEAMLCIGDGYIFVFDDAIVATKFGARLATTIEGMVAGNETPVEFHFRMGVHTGPVYSFWDVGRNDWNYIGAGINGGNRVLSAIGKESDDILFVSDQVRNKIWQASHGPKGTINRHDLLPYLQNRGRKKDKHGNPWRVYEVNHVGVTSRFGGEEKMLEATT